MLGVECVSGDFGGYDLDRKVSLGCVSGAERHPCE